LSVFQKNSKLTIQCCAAKRDIVFFEKSTKAIQEVREVKEIKEVRGGVVREVNNGHSKGTNF
jgi:hypothetical protein